MPQLIRFSKRARLIEYAAGIGIALCLCFLMAKVAFMGTQGAACNDFKSHLSISMAIFDKRYHHLPPGNEYRNNGMPPLSWRVSLLDSTDHYLKYQSLYNVKEPWNSLENSKLYHAENPGYHCPLDSSEDCQTSYVRISGKTTPFPDDRVVSASEFSGGASNTILLVEMHNSGIHWMEPRDITIDQAIDGIRMKSKPPVKGSHAIISPRGGTWAAFADGSVRFLNSNIDPKLLRSLLEIDNPDKPREKYTSP